MSESIYELDPGMVVDPDKGTIHTGGDESSQMLASLSPSARDSLLGLAPQKHKPDLQARERYEAALRKSAEEAARKREEIMEREYALRTPVQATNDAIVEALESRNAVLEARLAALEAKLGLRDA